MGDVLPSIALLGLVGLVLLRQQEHTQDYLAKVTLKRTPVRHPHGGGGSMRSEENSRTPADAGDL